MEEIGVSQPQLDSDHHEQADSAAPGATVGSFDAKIMRHLEHHIDDEREALAEYGTLLQDSDNPAVRYLLGLLLEDEQRHHRILIEMLNQFDAGAYLADESAHVPWMTRKPDAEAAAAIRRLRRTERADLRKLRRLRRQLKFLRRHSLDGVLVDSLIFDTRKHLRYLRTIQRLV
jgi:hypothetical protein